MAFCHSYLGSCVDEVNNFHCVCAAGYLGRTCSNATDECLTLPCQNGGTCTDLHRDYNVRINLKFESKIGYQTS